MKISLQWYANRTNFRIKSCTLSRFRIEVKTTRKWPIWMNFKRTVALVTAYWKRVCFTCFSMSEIHLNAKKILYEPLLSHYSTDGRALDWTKACRQQLAQRIVNFRISFSMRKGKHWVWVVRPLYLSCFKQTAEICRHFNKVVILPSVLLSCVFDFHACVCIYPCFPLFPAFSLGVRQHFEYSLSSSSTLPSENP